LQRRYEDLIELAEEKMISNPDDIKAVYMLAFAYNATGKSAQAKNLLERYGLPGISHTASSVSADDEAFVSYLDALQAVGDNARAQQLAIEHRELSLVRIMGERDFGHAWWTSANYVCTQVVAGDIPAALAVLDGMKEGRGLAWSPLMMDRPCYKKVAAEPRYLAVIERLEERQSIMRARLPATLVEHGVADVRPRSL
jgi:hypothetical protein